MARKNPPTAASNAASVRLPDAALHMAREHSEVWEAFQNLGEKASRAGPLDGRTRRLIHLAVAIAVGSEGVPVGQLVMDELLGHLVKEELACADLVLLPRGQGGHDKSVADVDVELVAGAPAGGVRLEASPQSFGRGVVWAGYEVLTLGAAAAHADVYKLGCAPDRVDPGSSPWHLLVWPVGEPEQRPGL